MRRKGSSTRIYLMSVSRFAWRLCRAMSSSGMARVRAKSLPVPIGRIESAVKPPASINPEQAINTLRDRLNILADGGMY